MISASRFTLLACLALTLLASGCGLRPMYGNYAAAPSAGFDDIDIAAIPNRSGVALRNDLIDLFYRDGYPQTPRYTLKISPVEERSSELDITSNSESTRAQLTQSTGIILTDRQTGEILLTQSVSSITSYNILESEFATRVTEDKARDSGLKDLARQIHLALSLYFNRQS